MGKTKPSALSDMSLHQQGVTRDLEHARGYSKIPSIVALEGCNLVCQSGKSGYYVRDAAVARQTWKTQPEEATDWRFGFGVWFAWLCVANLCDDGAEISYELVDRLLVKPPWPSPSSRKHVFPHSVDSQLEDAARRSSGINRQVWLYTEV